MNHKLSSKTSDPQTKTASIVFAHGCPRVEVDAALLSKYLKINGWKVTDNMHEAEFILASTCGFNDLSEQKSMERLSIINKLKRKEAKLLIFGCLPAINNKKLLDEFDALTVTSTTLNKLDNIIKAEIGIDNVADPNILNGFIKMDDGFTQVGRTSYINKLFRKLQMSPEKLLEWCYTRFILGYGPVPLYNKFSEAYAIRIARGCLEDCSYCAAKFDEGSLQSKPFDRLIEDFRAGLENGHKLFRLIATDIGAYGQDIEKNIVDLLRSLFAHDANFRLIWDDFHPKWLIKYLPQLVEIISMNSNRIGYIGFPIQSGSDKIIQLMKRDYTSEHAKRSLIKLRDASPDIVITSHVLIGFPGETEEDFDKTIRFCSGVKFDHIFAYLYSDRPLIESSKLPNKIPETIKKKRLWRFRKTFRKTCTI
jgi:tRNA A37 methylthiotransferase MiaB